MTEPFEADFAATALDPDEMFQANLPWFVNGTLDAKDKAEMEAYIQAHPTAVKQLAAYREFSAAVRDQSARSPAELPSFAQLEKKIISQRAQETPWTSPSLPSSDHLPPLGKQAAGSAESMTERNGFPRLPDKRHRTLWQTVGIWFGKSVVWPRLAGLAVLVALTVQAVLLGVLHGDLKTVIERESEVRASSATTAIGPFIRVAFQTEAQEIDLRVLLIGVGASYVSGPSQLGDYYLFVDRKYTEQAMNELRTSPLVRNAELVAKVPALD